MTSHARMIVVGVIVPLAISVAGIIAILVALPTLPPQIATHWGPSGAPDGFGSPVTGIVVLAVFTIGYAALAFVVARQGDGRSTTTQRILVALSPALSTLLAVGGAGSTVMQSGLANGHDAPSIFPALIAGFGLAILAAVVAWFVLPAATPAPAAAHVELPAIDLGADQRASWLQYIEPARVVSTLAIGGMALVIVGGGVAMAFTAPTGILVLWVVGMLLVGALVVSALFWTVRIDRKGLVVRSAMGVPRFIIPASDVAKATVIDVVPLRDFAGYGIRGIGGRIGVIVRAGEAIEVTRHDGRVFVVTVAQSRQGAALLNAVAARA